MAAAMERTNLTRTDVIEFIQIVDEKRDNWVKFLSHVDRNDISTYDLVINFNRINIPSACDLICQNISLSDYQTGLESQNQLGDLVLATEVRAKIADMHRSPMVLTCSTGPWL